MINEHMMDLGSRRSTIRELFEYGNSRAAIVGRENVFDFSIGNPNVPAPEAVRQAIYVEAAGDPVALHGYTSAQGAADVRGALADSLNKRFGTDYTGDSLYLTAGAAAALSCAFKAIVCEGDEIIVFAPYFPEYKMFIESGAGAKCVIVPPSIADFQIDFGALEQCLNEHTKAVVVNSPNNPSGAVYSEQTIKRLADILRDKEKEYGHPIYLISDEPYREIYMMACRCRSCRISTTIPLSVTRTPSRCRWPWVMYRQVPSRHRSRRQQRAVCRHLARRALGCGLVRRACSSVAHASRLQTSDIGGPHPDQPRPAL